MSGTKIELSDEATEYLDEIQRRCRNVDRLLSDRQPGLISWCAAWAMEMEALTKLWKEGAECTQEKLPLNPVPLPPHIDFGKAEAR